jgi:hypothetical protein
MSLRRHIVGLIALVAFALAVLPRIVPSLGAYSQLDYGWRVGAIMAAWWLAYDDLNRLPAWLLAGVPVLAIILVRWPKYFFLAIPVLIVLAILKPRFGARGKR